MASLAIWCEFLCILDVSSLPMSENGVTVGRLMMFVGITGGCGRGSEVFFMFLMMKCCGYARANRVRVKLLSSSWRMWSSEMIML